VELIKEHREDVEKVAKLLLDRETITHDDMVDLIGDRPFVKDAQYQEYVSSRSENKAPQSAENSADKEIKLDNEPSDAKNNEGGLTPGLA
jgi:AFG3 family protein